MDIQVGICCAGTFCTTPHLQLRRSGHSCSICKGIVHLNGVCSTASLDENGDDVFKCAACLSKRSVAENVSKSAASAKVKNPCPKCGGTDHQRSSSKKCKFYKASAARNPPKIIDTTNSQSSGSISTVTTSGNSVPIELPPASDPASDTPASSIGTSSSSRTLKKPNFVPVGIETTTKKHKGYRPVVDVCHPSFQPNDTVFRIVDDQNSTVVPTAETLMDKYLSDDMIEMLVRNSNTYINMRKRNEPQASCWKKRGISAPLDRSSMYHFIAILYYMGISKLPSKRDYWTTKQWMPYHPLVHELGMTRDRFLFIWRHFHVSDPSENMNSIHTEADEIDDVTADDAPVVTAVERIVADQEENGEERDETEEIASEEDVRVWFDKIKPLVDHFRDVTFEMVHVLGTLLSFDEMMVRFMGRSGETHRMKHKQKAKDTNYLP